MKKIFIVHRDFCDTNEGHGSDVLGVCSTMENAIKRMHECIENEKSQDDWADYFDENDDCVEELKELNWSYTNNDTNTYMNICVMQYNVD